MNRRSNAAGNVPCARRTIASIAGGCFDLPLAARDAWGFVGSSFPASAAAGFGAGLPAVRTLRSRLPPAGERLVMKFAPCRESPGALTAAVAALVSGDRPW